MVNVLVALGAAGLVGYLETRKLPRGGTITVLDEFDRPVTYTDEEAWRYTTWERVEAWLFGRLPGGGGGGRAPAPVDVKNPFAAVTDWLRQFAPKPPAPSSGDPLGGGIQWGAQGPNEESF